MKGPQGGFGMQNGSDGCLQKYDTNSIGADGGGHGTHRSDGVRVSPSSETD